MTSSTKKLRASSENFCCAALGATLIAALLPRSAQAQRSPAASKACLVVQSAERPSQDRPLYRVQGTSRCPGPLGVRLAVRRTGAPVYRLLPGSVEVAGPGGFAFEGANLSEKLDAQGPVEIVALGSELERPLAGEWRSASKLREGASAYSALWVPPSKAARESDSVAKVRLLSLDGRDLSRGPRAEYDVALQAHAQGTARVPRGATVQCAVQPANSNGRWIMMNGHISDGDFDCVGQFGEGENFSEFENFLLYAVVSRPALQPEHGAYSSEEWELLLASRRILAVSPTVHVRRVIDKDPTISGSPQSMIAIRRVGSETANGGSLTVRRLSEIEGEVSGLPLSTHRIAIYVRSEAGDAPWRKLGSALSSDGRRWLLLPALLGEPDERILIMAVRYQGHAPDLNNEGERQALVARSEIVRATIVDPALEITRVCGSTPNPEAGRAGSSPLEIGSDCRVEGSQSEKPAPGRVAVYARPEAGNAWKLLAQVDEPVSPRWETQALSFGTAGSYVVVAVSRFAKAEPDRLPKEPGVRTSLPIHVRVGENR